MDNTQNVAVPPPPVMSATPQQPVIDPQIPQGNRFSKKMLIILIGALLVIILLITGAYYFLTQKQSSLTPTPTAIQTPTVTVAPVTPTNNPELKITLVKDIEQTIPGTTIKAKYLGKKDPEAGCFDCGTTYTVQIVQANQAKELIFACGGITGACSEAKIERYTVLVGQKVTDTEMELQLKE